VSRFSSRLACIVAASLALVPVAGADVFPGEEGAPSIEIAYPVNGFGYPQGAEVIAGYGCWSDVIDLVLCEGSVPIGSPVETATAGEHTFTVRAADYEGRESTASVTYTVMDLTPPSVDFRAPAHLAEYELGDQVFVDYDCVDNLGGLGVAYCEGTRPRGALLDTSRVGAFELRVDAVDAAGNYRAWTSTYSVVDRYGPTITISTPVDGAAYTLGSNVLADYACFDRPPGALVFCSGDVAVGSPLDTTTLGPRTFRVAALDTGRNVARASSTYTVVYEFAGFFAPASEPLNRAEAGDVVPVKFSLGGDQGLDVFASGSPRWRPCGSLDAAASDGRLAYHGERYVYRWETDESWAGSCRELAVTLRDGTVHTARFTFT
jgi:hypothetical protein